MTDLNLQEQAQLGLKYVEDAVVNLLTRHAGGMNTTAIAEALGLQPDLTPQHRDMIVAGILELLARSGRIVWSEADGVYKDNPERS